MSEKQVYNLPKKILQTFFSIKNDKNNHKAITILGIKLKTKGFFIKYREYIKDAFSYTYSNLTKGSGVVFPFERSLKYLIRYFTFRYFLTGKISIGHLEYKILTKCTLNCKECCHYAPYFNKQMQPITFEQFKTGLDKLLKTVDLIYSLNIMGGEALLSKDLAKMIKYALSKKQIKHVNLTTNCLTMPNDDLIEAIKNQKRFLVFMSDYSMNKDLLPRLKTERIKEIFNKNSINYLTLRNDVWFKAPEMSFDGTKYNTHSKDCWMYRCRTYANGKIYLCLLQFYSDFNNKPLKIKEDEIINIENESPQNSSKALLNFYYKKQFDFCCNCNIQPSLKVEPAVQV